MSGRKKLSGAEYRKRKAEKEKSLSKQEASLHKYILCPNGRKKSHFMLVRRAACSQLCLGIKIG